MVRQALILWVKEGKWDVWASTRLPAEHRQEGSIGMFPWDDGKTYLGKVIRISSSTKEIERAEAKLCEKVSGADSEALVHGRRNSKQPVRTGKSASDNQVSQALGEKKKLNSEQAALKKQAALEKKQREEAMKDAEKEEDLNLFPASKQVKRSLLFQESVSSSMMPKTNEQLSSEETDSDDDQPMGTIADLESVHDEDEENLDDDEDEDRTTCHEPSISEFKNPNTQRFLRFLLNAFNPTPESWTLRGSSREVKVFAKPLKGVEGQKMVRLKKNHSLMVSKASKTALLVDFKSRQSSTVFLRKTLEEIYGADQLSRMTAMGRLKDSVGIPKQDLNAIYDFVTEYSNGDLSWVDFKITINKKCSSMKSLSNKKSSSKKSKLKGTMRSTSTCSDSDQGILNKSNSESLGTPNKRHAESLQETPNNKRQRLSPEAVRVTPTKLAQKIVANPLISAPERPKSPHSTSVNGYSGSRPVSGPHHTHHSSTTIQGPHSGQHSAPGNCETTKSAGPYVSYRQPDEVVHADQHSNSVNGYSGHNGPFYGPHYIYNSSPTNQGPPRQHSSHYEPYLGYQKSSIMSKADQHAHVKHHADHYPSVDCGNQAGQHSFYGYENETYQVVHL